MRLKNFFRMTTANTLYWLIAVPIILIGTSVVTVVLMSWVVTVAVIFEIILPLKVITVLVGLATFDSVNPCQRLWKPASEITFRPYL